MLTRRRVLLFFVVGIVWHGACNTFAQTPPPAKPWPQVKVLLAAARDANAPYGLPLRMLFDFKVRDANISTGPDGMFYLVATTESTTKTVSMWWENDGVRMWKSSDLQRWTAVTGPGEPQGFVWTFDKDGTWSKEWKRSPFVSPHGELRRALWAPEIHYFHKTFWIPYSMNYTGTGLLKSTTGRVEGPYVDVKTDGPLTDGIDASVFADEDGSVYFLHNGYSIAKMKADMSDVAETSRDVDVPGKRWGEGIYMVKVGGRYILINSGNPHTEDASLPDTYDSYSAVSESSPYGPYKPLYRAIPFDGHNNLFQGEKGEWWSSFFGSGPNNPWQERPGVVAITISKNGVVGPKRTMPRPRWSYATSNPGVAWMSGSGDAGLTGEGAFGDVAVARSGFFTDVGTEWKDGEIWMRRRFDVKGPVPAQPRIYLRADGPVEIYLNGVLAYQSADAMVDYKTVPIAADASLRSGGNVIAVHVGAKAGVAPYVDVGLVNADVAR